MPQQMPQPPEPIFDILVIGRKPSAPAAATAAAVAAVGDMSPDDAQRFLAEAPKVMMEGLNLAEAQSAKATGG